MPAPLSPEEEGPPDPPDEPEPDEPETPEPETPEPEPGEPDEPELPLLGEETEAGSDVDWPEMEELSL